MKKLSKLTKSKFVIATNSGTSALHLALKAINIKFDSEVLIPSLNFVASANAIKYCNAEPHFIDSDQKIYQWIPKVDRIFEKKY